MRILAAALVLVAACGGDGVGPTPRPTFTTVRVMLADAQVRAEVVRYPSDGLSVAGIVCRPVAPGKYPILMLNHGGWGGLGGELEPTTSSCVGLARAGWVVIEPSYRGEDGSGGTIELCLGEATDIRLMLEAVVGEPFADSTRVIGLGGSHGGCSTLRAIVDGLRPGRMVAVAGPTDWAHTYRAIVDSIPNATGDRLGAFEFLSSEVRKYLGGTPDQVPAAYALRSLLTRSASLDRWQGKLLIQHGVDDEIVAVEESCALVAVAHGFTAYHVAGNGQVVTTPPAKCTASGLTWSAGPLPSGWPGSRYLVIYDGLGHGTGQAAGRQTTDALAFLTAP